MVVTTTELDCLYVAMTCTLFHIHDDTSAVKLRVLFFLIRFSAPALSYCFVIVWQFICIHVQVMKKKK